MDILVENVTVSYGSQKAVDNISLKVSAGEILGFLGPNGAGKTTTMKAIACFLTPQQGEIKVGGNSIHTNSDAVKALIGYLPEHNPLYLDMGVIDYLRFVAKLQGIKADIIDDRIIEMIKITGLNKEKHKKIGELSKGYRQRVGIAQALIHDPEVLILDEPTTGLDPNQRIEIRELIKTIGKEKTVMLSSHILAEVEATCDRILIINQGKIVADGTPGSLRKQAHGNEVLHVKIEDAEVETIVSQLSLLSTIQSVIVLPTKNSLIEIQSIPGESSKRPIFDLCVTKKWYLTEMQSIETKLEDIFRDLTMN